MSRTMTILVAAAFLLSSCTSDNAAAPTTVEPAPTISCGKGTHLVDSTCEIIPTTTTEAPATTTTRPAPTTTATTEPATTTTTTEPPAPTDPPVTVPKPLNAATVAFYQTPLGSAMCGVDFATAKIVAKSADTTIDADSYARICAGEPLPVAPTNASVPTNGSVPANVLTAAEFSAALEAPLTAWMLAPSGPGFDAISAGAQSLIYLARPFPPFTEDVVHQLLGYPGQDWMVYDQADTLRPLIPGIPFLLAGGSYKVGDEVPAGTYRTTDDVDGCYWETLDEAGDINRNNFVNATTQVIMTVRKSDFVVNTDGCGTWVRTGG